MLNVKMSIEELGQEVVTVIKNQIPHAEVEVREIIKTNDLVLHGVTIRDTTKENQTVPTVYLERFEEEYFAGDITVEEIAEEIISITNDSAAPIPPVISQIGDFESIKSRLRIKLINTEKNKEFLKGVAHKEFLDLSALYQIKVEMGTDDSSIATVNIGNELFDKYGITIDELHEAAIENMKIMEPTHIQGMFQTMVEIMGEEMRELPLDMFGDEEEKMLVITNKSKVCGASVILQKETLQEIADIFKQDYYILPSSIHEVLAVKADGNVDASALRDMVKEVNDTQVMPEELLSYNVYYYNTETGELSIA